MAPLERRSQDEAARAYYMARRHYQLWVQLQTLQWLTRKDELLSRGSTYQERITRLDRSRVEGELTLLIRASRELASGELGTRICQRYHLQCLWLPKGITQGT